MSREDTIFAHSSGRPPAAIAVVRISGPLAHQAGRALGGTLPDSRHAALRTVRDTAGMELDRALVLRFDGPASATGEDLVELHCHGGRAVVQAVLHALGGMEGLRQAEPGEFTRRSLQNGRIDLTEAEGLADLLEAETESQRRSALALAQGGLKQQVERWRAELVSLSAQAEAAIDYVGDEDETSTDEVRLARKAQDLASELEGWLAQPRAERLKDGVRVVLAGPPNSGKSSLLNALVGEDRAIVTELAGTTRDIIEVPLALGGVPLLLIDTAGIRTSADAVENIGIELANQQMAAADILLWLGQPEDAPTHANLLRLHSRADAAGRGDTPVGSIAISSVTGQGLPQLREELVARAHKLLPPSGQLALNSRQAAAIAQIAESLREVRSGDIVLTAEALRSARAALDRLTGAAGLEDMLDALFGRFCLGK